MKKILILLFFIPLLWPSFALAEVGCRCFCGTEQGALPPSGGESVSASSCETLCGKTDQKVVICASDPAHYPANFPRCFTRDDCTRQCKERSDPKDPDTCTFGSEQPKECIPGQHYCYRDDKPYTLAYGIPEEGGAAPTEQKVVNVGEFINLAYRFLLWGGVIIAIVMIMIGGFKMVLSAATDKVKGGKDQIRNAVIGLVILLAAGLILQTVNPQLLSLTPPKLPMLKTVEFLGAGQSCEELIEKSGADKQRDDKVPTKDQEKLSNFGKKSCGTIVAIRAKDGKPPIPSGSTCTYTRCPSKDPQTGESIPAEAKCIPNGEQSTCVTCRGLIPSFTRASPSSSTCEKLKKTELSDEKDLQTGEIKPRERNYCFYSHHPSLVVSNEKVAGIIAALVAAGGVTYVTGGLTLPMLLTSTIIASDVLTDAVKGTCAELSLNCEKIRNIGCGGYDAQQVGNTLTDNELDDLSISSTFGSVNLKVICEQDPCKVGKPGAPCRLAQATGVESVVKSITCTSLTEVEKENAAAGSWQFMQFGP